MLKGKIYIEFDFSNKSERKAYVLSKHSIEMTQAFNEIFNKFGAEEINKITEKFGFNEKDIRYYGKDWIKKNGK